MIEAFYSHWELFGYAYMSALLLAVMGAYLGVYVVLRRVVFLGMGLIQIAAVGVALAYLLGGSPLVFSLLATFAGILLFSFTSDSRKISRESLIGVAYCCAGAVAILVIKKSALGTEELTHYLYGQILLVNPSQFWIMTATFATVALFHWAFAKEILFTSFDRETARAVGIRVAFWDFSFYFTLGAVIAVSTKAAGMLMMFGYLVIPAVTALLCCQRMGTTFVTAIATSVLATIAGLFLQHIWEFPPGQTIVAMEGALLLLIAMWQRTKWATAILLALLIGCYFYNANEQNSQNQHDDHHHHAPEQQVTVDIVPTRNVYQPGETIELNVALHNHSQKHYHFFLHLDVGGIEPIIAEFTLPPAHEQQRNLTIPKETAQFLSGELLLLPAFYLDKEGLEPVSFAIDEKPVRIYIE